MLNVVFWHQMAQCGDKGLAIVQDDLHKDPSATQDILKDPVTDRLSYFFVKHLEFQIVRERALFLDNIEKAIGLRKMHGVHIHFDEKWGQSIDDGWNGNLMSLVDLTNMAGPDKPGDIAAHKCPPVSLHK